MEVCIFLMLFNLNKIFKSNERDEMSLNELKLVQMSSNEPKNEHKWA